MSLLACGSLGNKSLVYRRTALRGCFPQHIPLPPPGLPRGQPAAFQGCLCPAGTGRPWRSPGAGAGCSPPLAAAPLLGAVRGVSERVHGSQTERVPWHGPAVSAELPALHGRLGLPPPHNKALPGSGEPGACGLVTVGSASVPPAAESVLRGVSRREGTADSAVAPRPAWESQVSPWQRARQCLPRGFLCVQCSNFP